MLEETGLPYEPLALFESGAILLYLAEKTGDSANIAQTQCSCGFQADSHSKATPEEWLTPVGK